MYNINYNDSFIKKQSYSVLGKERMTPMKDYVLSCCSTADLSQERFEEREISYICFHYELDGRPYLDDFGKSIPYDEFYEKMQQGADTKTSQINAEEYEEYFERFLQDGKDILHLCLSSGITSTMNSALIAKEALSEKYPDSKILIVDSLAASAGYGLFMEELADLRDAGQSIDEVYQFVMDYRLNIQHWFFSTDLTFFIKGGRVSKTSGMIGTMLGICPLLNVDFEGRLIPREKIRGKKRVIQKTLDKMIKYAENGKDYDGRCYISQSACFEDARELADLIETTFPNLKGKVEIFDIGTTIGSHTGPGTVALFFKGDKRLD